MEKRQLGHSDLVITKLGLGTWVLGGGEWAYGLGHQDDGESIDTIRYALELGINWVDTAADYGLGHSEEVVGKAISGWDEKVIAATKCGRIWKKGGTKPYSCLESESIRREVDASLRRLGIDVIDLYQIHLPTPDEDLEEAWSTIAELVKEGKVRYCGICNCTIEQLTRLQRIHPVTSLQWPYSILRRSIERHLLPFCRENEIGVLVYSPMESGLLGGRFTKHRILTLSDSDVRKSIPRFQEPELSANLQLVNGLRPIAERNQMSVAQLAVAWVLQQRGVTAAIVGARRPAQIEETAKAVGCKLSAKDLSDIAILQQERDEHRTDGRADLQLFDEK